MTPERLRHAKVGVTVRFFYPFGYIRNCLPCLPVRLFFILPVLLNFDCAISDFLRIVEGSLLSTYTFLFH